jgi:hypothetical protein
VFQEVARERVASHVDGPEVQTFEVNRNDTHAVAVDNKGQLPAKDTKPWHTPDSRHDTLGDANTCTWRLG